MAEVNDAATATKTSVDSTLDKIVPQAEPKTVILLNHGQEIKLVQKPLGFFQKLDLFSYLGDAVDLATSGKDGLSISSVLGDFTRGPNQAPQGLNPDVLVQGVAKLAQYVPNVIQQSFCIILNVPKEDREAIIEIMSRPKDEGGLSDDDAIGIIETFFDQNADEVKDFFDGKLRRLSERWRETFSPASKGSSKRSKTTRRTTPKP